LPRDDAVEMCIADNECGLTLCSFLATLRNPVRKHQRPIASSCWYSRRPVASASSVGRECGGEFSRVVRQINHAGTHVVSDPGGKVMTCRRQKHVRQLKDAWPVGFCTYIGVTLLLR
jgi:hypothetical protein